MNLKQFSYLLGIAANYASIIFSKKKFQERITLYCNRRIFQCNQEQFPLEFVNQIKINDSAGLEGLLTRTAEKEKLEWGTAFRTQADNGTAVITDILDSRKAETQGIIHQRGERALCLNTPVLRQKGYNGVHHYHPVDIFSNYSLGVADRIALTGLVHLLTFNLPNGPEIIGYNGRYTYIPLSKNKSELVKVNFKEIWNYLK